MKEGKLEFAVRVRFPHQFDTLCGLIGRVDAILPPSFPALDLGHHAAAMKPEVGILPNAFVERLVRAPRNRRRTLSRSKA